MKGKAGLSVLLRVGLIPPPGGQDPLHPSNLHTPRGSGWADILGEGSAEGGAGDLLHCLLLLSAKIIYLYLHIL